jgi:hypothetical protein
MSGPTSLLGAAAAPPLPARQQRQQRLVTQPFSHQQQQPYSHQQPLATNQPQLPGHLLGRFDHPLYSRGFFTGYGFRIKFKIGLDFGSYDKENENKIFTLFVKNVFYFRTGRYR